MLNPYVLFGQSASRAKGCGSPTRGWNAASKAKHRRWGIDESLDNLFVAWIWYLNQESEQYVDQGNEGQRDWCEKEIWGWWHSVKIIHVPGNLLDILSLFSLLLLPSFFSQCSTSVEYLLVYIQGEKSN